MNTTANDITVNLTTATTVTKGKAGRPATNLNFPSKGSFTLKDVQNLNPAVKPVTVRAGLSRAVTNGIVTKLVKTVKTGHKGKPASRFMTTEALNALKARDVVNESIAA